MAWITDLNFSSPFNFRKEASSEMKRVKFGSLKNIRAPLVLIVEQDDDTRLMMKYLLEIWKYQVVEAVSGEEAVILAESNHPDVIFLDFKMTKIDGLTAIRRMRQQTKGVRTIIISTSADAGPAVRASALAAGSDDFLTKPFNFGEMENSLKKLLWSNRIY